MAATAAQLKYILPYFPAKDLSAFHVESLLGGGGFSHVVLARDAHGSEWALKLIPAPGANSLADVDITPLLLSEARIHLFMSNEPSVLPCIEAFKSVYVDSRDPKHATYMAVIQMPVAACTVEEWLFSATPVPQTCQSAPQSQVDEAEVLSVWLQMVNAVHRCHANGIVHKDVKMPNFLMDNRGKVQIMDFGLAHVEGVTPRSVAGTPWTMSPAGLKHGDDGRAGDWWALGIVLYQLLQGGAWPFKHCWWPWQKGGGERMEAAIRRAVLAGRITFPHGARVSEPVKALIRGLLQPDPNRRWQLRQVLACEAVKPELLSQLAQRFPELVPDMQALLMMQQRARGIQALGSDGGSAAAAAVASLALAGSAIAAAASSVVNRARGVSALVGEGGLHWPHWGPGGGKGEPGVGDGSSNKPLLEGEDREEDELPARLSGPSAPLFGAAARRLVSAGSAVAQAGTILQATQHQQQEQLRHSHEQPPQPQVAEGARVTELLLLFPDEVADAQSSLPSTPKDGELLPPQAAHSAAPPGLVSAPSEPGDASRTGDPSAAAGTLSPRSSNGPTAAGAMRHANTMSAGVAPLDSSVSLSVDSEGKRGCSIANQHHSPRLSRRSLSGPQISPGHGSSPRRTICSASSRRFERTSLHDLFGVHSGSQQLPSLPYQHQRALSGAGLGGPLAIGSWAIPRGLPALQREPGSDGRSSGGADPAALPLPSSWVPPPPEAFAAAAATAAATGGGGTRQGGVCSQVQSSQCGSTARGGLCTARSADSADAHAPEVSDRTHHRHPGFLSRARRLFSDCLQRPGAKYDAYDYDELEALPAPGRVS
ncbi:hypothetical protein Vretimale_9479 [Volvox reticuliferus]|uniref:Protein kinase domain-containing protein n=1 Tax=Volvox reticuliferus TaxID=1737510 RepID=A0A8J4LPT8_9CHLO|nr:hypothetical protein Vretifemale_18722 [Volvox reticuliferus]GIM05010.1 hypothetical protein Vretimale_9479 [Volvox reticuliferus]